MVEQPHEIKKTTALKTGFEASDQGYPRESYLDEKKYEKEQEILSKVTRDLASRVISSLKFPDRESNSQWGDLALRPKGLLNTTQAITETVGNTSLKGTIFETDIIYILTTAKDLLTLESIEKQRKLAIDNDFYHSRFREYERLTNFNINGNLFMKIGGISILDFFRKADITPAEYYNCMINAWLTKNQLAHDKILLKNNDELTALYPNTSKQLIQESCGQILGITDLTPQLVTLLFSHFPPSTNLGREIVQKAKNIVRRTDILEQKVFDVIFNPTSPFFLPLKEKLEAYLNNENPTVKILALQKLGLKTRDRVVNAYRKAKKRASENNEYSPFYAQLANLIKKYNIEECPQEFNIFTRDDVIMFVNDNVVNKAIPTLKDLKSIKMGILQKSSKLEYTINPSGIDWQGLIEPTAATVKFYRDFPNKTNIVLYYENDKGEKVKLSFDINTKNKEEKIDWDFLESPNDTEMEDMRNTALLSARSALLAVQKQAEIEHQEKQRARATNTTTPSIEKHKENTWIPREKKEKTTQLKPLFVIEETLRDKILPSAENGIKKHIDSPKDVDIRTFMKNLSLENQEKIIERIKRFNEGGLGRFKALTDRKYHGKPVCELRVGDFRVLVVEADSKNGNGSNDVKKRLQSFEIVEIGDRKDIFK